MSLDLILKDIEDPYVRENFFRLARFINEQTILGGNWKLYKIEVPRATVNFEFKHNLRFIPKHILVLSVEGNKKVDFRHDLFTKENIVLTTEGAVCVTILAGRYNETCDVTGLAQVPIYDPPTIIVNPGSASVVALFNTDIVTAVGDLCYLNGVQTVTRITSNSSGVIPHGIFGIVYTKPTTTTCNVLFLGEMTGYAGFTTGAALFISSAGLLTHTPPTTGMVQQIGFATDVGKIFVNLKQPMRRA